MAKVKDLSDIRNYFYDKSENLWWWILGISSITQILSLAALWCNNEKFLIAIGFIAIISPISESWLREWADNNTNNADKCRRLILYSDGLGEEITKENLAAIRALVSGVQLKEAPFIKPYYSSCLPQGPNRLADITTEAAFFTADLARRVKNYLTGFLIISALILFFILYFAITNIVTDNNLVNLAKAATSIMPFIMAGNILLLRFKYSELHNSAEKTFKQCARMRKDTKLREQEILNTVEDYHLKLIQSPPIPFIIYEKYKVELNEVYRSSHLLPECKNG